jgi:hypothetical protein
LQHDFRNPNAIRIPAFAPWQRALLAMKPLQQIASECSKVCGLQRPRGDGINCGARHASFSHRLRLHIHYSESKKTI